MSIFKKINLLLRISFLNISKRLKKGRGYPIHYIGGSEALPPPLSVDEEAYLISANRTGLWCKKRLIERNLRLVVYIARV